MKQDIALLLLRLSGLGLAFGHGWGKIVRLATGQGEGLIQFVGSLGFPLPGLFAWAAALAEFLAALLVALGFGTRIAAAFAGFTMFVAAFVRYKAHLHLLVKLGLMSAGAEQLKGWGDPELALAYLIIFVSLTLTGGGRFAVERLIRKR